MAWLDQTRRRGEELFGFAQLPQFEFEGQRIPLMDRQRGIRKPALDDAQLLAPAEAAASPERRRYAQRLTRLRLHQPVFRSRVLHAYQRRCSICRLRHDELLDAAHILPDGHPRGLPVVPNGLALCKIHHAAYDRDILGVRPDLIVEIRSDILREIDGPMLQHGLQEMAGTRLHVPHSRHSHPDPGIPGWAAVVAGGGCSVCRRRWGDGVVASLEADADVQSTGGHGGCVHGAAVHGGDR